MEKTHVQEIKKKRSRKGVPMKRRAFHTGRRVERKDRPCLGCGDVFPSAGIHNRMCYTCINNVW